MLPRAVTAAMALALPLLPHVAWGQAAAPAAPDRRDGAAAVPQPTPPFGGRIGRVVQESAPDFPREPTAPEGAPNVVLIMLDDVGFAQTGTFGGLTPTPNLDALAGQGLRYTRFHTTALCSPTRASLLTGRTPHAAGTGVVADMAGGYPGYTSVIPRETGTIAQVLQGNGYSTAWFGKNHNVPEWQSSAVGPFDRWPRGMGFDYFLGFVGGDTSQWDPALVENTSLFEMPPEQRGTHLTSFLADRAIGWMRQHRAIAPQRPFFLYFVPGATHSPHHAPRDWVDRFRGQFDMGWDRYREMAFERQRQLGVVPPDARLTPRPDSLPAWDSLPADQRRLAARMMEVMAGFTAHTDAEVGRVIASLDTLGVRDNTLVVFIVGDNGASAEGGVAGVVNEMRTFNALPPEDLQENLRIIDEIGGPLHHNNFPAGWGWAMNTPFPWTKQVASHLGGTRNPVVISWPRRITDRGGVRTQFHHVSDVMPTILEAVNLRMPQTIDGVQQRPLDGISMAYTFDRANADAPGRRTTQVFEMMLNRAIYHDGWMASARWRTPWATTPRTDPIEAQEWELYHLDQDFSQSENLAAREPARLRQLQELWWVEAARNNILPLDNRLFERFDPRNRPSLVAGRTSFTYFPGIERLPQGAAPDLKNRSFTITAEVDIPANGGEGMIINQGGRWGGWGIYFDRGGRLTYLQNFVGTARYAVTTAQPVAPGRRIIRLDFDYDGGGMGRGATARLSVDGTPAGEGRIERTVPINWSLDEGLDVGLDHGTPLTEDYAQRLPFRFNGRIAQVTIDLR
jgi:arylsulfatase A-like enzyme